MVGLFWSLVEKKSIIANVSTAKFVTNHLQSVSKSKASRGKNVIKADELVVANVQSNPFKMPRALVRLDLHLTLKPNRETKSLPLLVYLFHCYIVSCIKHVLEKWNWKIFQIHCNLWQLCTKSCFEIEARNYRWKFYGKIRVQQWPHSRMFSKKNVQR